jgi:MraZ protein
LRFCLTLAVKNGRKRQKTATNGKRCVTTRKSSSESQVVYTGQDEYRIDPSRRVMLPSRWRSDEKEFWVVPWPLGKRDCLMVVPAPRFQKTLDALSGKSLSDKAALAVQRVIGGTAQKLKLDSAGRMLIPESLTNVVGIKADALFVGMMDKFEIWDPKRHAAASVADEAIAAEAVGGMEL